MKKIILCLGIAAILSVLYYSIQAQEGFRTLDDVKADGDSVIMTLSGETKFNVFKISNPPRLVVEFTNTEHNTKIKEFEVNTKYIKRVRSGQFENEPAKIARVVIDLNEMVEYDLKGSGNQVTLTLNPNKSSTETAAVEAAAAQSDDTLIAKPYEETKNAKEAPVEKAQVKTEKKPAVQAKKAAPAAKKPASAVSTRRVILPKTPVTLDFEEAEIKDVLRILSIKSGINLIHGDEVAGTITLHLENVPFDKAFETILALKGLISQEQGSNILRITTPLKINEERNQSVTFTKVYPLNYAKAEEVVTNVNAIRNAEGRRGSVTVDQRTNSIIVTDSPEGLASIEGVIAELDKQPYQVIIEAKIVEVVLTDDLDLGIQWQYAGQVSNNPNMAIGQTVATTGDTGFGVTQTGADIVSPLGTAAGGTGVSFPAAATGGMTSQIAFGIWGDGRYLTGMINALAQKGLSKILSTPKVTTINNKEAKILVGQRIPYTTTTISNAGSTQATQFLDVGIKLTVTPTINANQKITLKVHPEVSLFVRADAAGPVLGTREADTTVMVSNGDTVVIGGLINEQDRKLGTQVPLLGDIPIIGHLFKRDYNSKERTELLVFLTPQIIYN